MTQAAVSEAHLEAISNAKDLEANGGVLLVGIGENEARDLHAVQLLPQLRVSLQEAVVVESVVDLGVPVIKVDSIAFGLHTRSVPSVETHDSV